MVKVGGKVKELMRKCTWKVKVKTWALVLAVLVLLPIDATLLRFNHIRMTELRDAVLAVDAKISDEEDEEEFAATEEELAKALADLKEFIFTNIVVNIIEENGVQRITFGTGPFYLEHQYLRAATRAFKEAESTVVDDHNPYGNIYGMAGEYCRGLAYERGWSWSSVEYINCMTGEITKYPASDELSDKVIAKLPSTELYRKNYASPVWTPSLAGWMILLTLALLMAIIIRCVVWLALRLALVFT